MPNNFVSASLAALALLACAASAAPDSPWRKQAVDKLFDCELAKDWTVKPLTAEATGFLLTDGLTRISAVRHEGRRARFATIGAFLKETETLGGPLRKLGMSEVADRNCARYQRRMERRHRQKGGETTEYIYEEFVLRPDSKGFWAIKLQSASLVHLEDPRGLAEWKRFLATFRPLAPQR